jgi:hypothetical protein
MVDDHHPGLITVLTIISRGSQISDWNGRVVFLMVGQAFQMVALALRWSGQLLFGMVSQVSIWNTQSASAQSSRPACQLRDNRVIITI